jgi:hypothetical protein
MVQKKTPSRQLLRESLLDVRGYELVTVRPDSITREHTYAAMLEWHRGR